MAPEYRARIHMGEHPDTGEAALVVLVETLREFTSFAYELSLTAKSTPHGLRIHIGGLTVPSVTRPYAGPARGVVYVPQPGASALRCSFHVKKRIDTCTLDIAHGEVHIHIESETAGVVLIEPGNT